MSITVHLDLGYEFTVRASAKAVFDVLSDVPRSASHFPNVEALTDLGDGVFQWDMEEVGTPQVNIRTVYASRYVSNRAKKTVTWSPVPDVGNAQIGGNWLIQANKGSTTITLTIEGQVEVPLPSLMRVVVEPVVAVEFERLVEAYIDNLIDTFGGEVEV